MFVQRYVNAHDEDHKAEKIKEAALQDFISDKYDSGVHFFEEILQNIDDAIGRKNKAGGADGNDCVEIRWNGKEIIFIYPDQGFSFYDLMAITSLGNSIKKGDIDQASIGEKGIGFKSVFSVATKIRIQSRFFGFDIAYDKNRKASVLQPDCITLPGSGEPKSSLTITFDEKFVIDGENGFKKELRKWLLENSKESYLNYSPFLFLKNVSNITYADDEEKTEIAIKRTSVDDCCTISEIHMCQYLVYKESLKFDKSLIENRWGKISAIEGKGADFSIDRPVEIAFPIVQDDEDFGNKKGLFYSYLPTEMEVDFPVYINVDVHLKSSRGRISEADFKDGSEWNRHIEGKLSDILVHAYLRVIKLYGEKDKGAYSEIKQIAEKLYKYIKEQKTKHYFCESLNAFYKKILTENIYLNVSNEFVAREDIHLCKFSDEKEWNDFTAFCLHKPFPDPKDGMQYSKSYGWYFFTRFEGHPYNIICFCSWKEKCLEIYQGIRNFYLNTELDKQEKNRIILNVLECIKSCNGLDNLSILFLEKSGTDLGYEISSKAEIEKNDKAVFFRPEDGKAGGNREMTDDDMSVYISRKPFDYGEGEEKKSKEDYDKYKKALKGIADEKDWKAYIGNILAKMKNEREPSENFCVYKCFNVCHRYLKNIAENDISGVTVPDNIKEEFKKYVIPSCVWAGLEPKDDRIYQKAIAKYLEIESSDKHYDYKLFDCSKTEMFDDIEKSLNFLIQLGVKARPDGRNFQNDRLSIAVMSRYDGISTNPDNLEFEYPGDKSYKYITNDGEIEQLQKYFVEFVNKEFEGYKKGISEIFEEKGLKIENIVFMPKSFLNEKTWWYIKLLGPQGGDKGKVYYQLGSSFRDAADEEMKYYIESQEKIDVNSGELLFADMNRYRCFAEKKWEFDYPIQKSDYDQGKVYSDNNENIIYRIIKKGPDDFLKRLRWRIIWNKVFSVKYAWDEDAVSISPCDFVSCYKYLKRSDIATLLPEGYCIKWHKGEIITLDRNIFPILTEYINNEFDLSMEENEFGKYYCIWMDKEIKVCIALDDYKELKDNNGFSYFIAIKKTKTPKTDYVEMILREKGLEISNEQRLEIAEIVGEIENLKLRKNRKIIGLTSEETQFTEAVFGDDDVYDEIIRESKKKLPSEWKKSKNNALKTDDWGMKEWLCEPFRVKDYIFQGYGYQCPICGSVMRHHSISGMKYIRFIRNADEGGKANLPYLYLISCLNCADMIERADKVVLKDYDGKSLNEALAHLKNVCYCVDNYHVFNHSKMKTMRLYLEIDDHEFVEQIKMSFPHMILLLKLLERKKTEGDKTTA